MTGSFSQGRQAVFPLSMLVFFCAAVPPASSQAPAYANPLVLQRADPWVYLHTDGWYYFTASVPEYDRIEIRRTRAIKDLGAAAPLVVWRRHESGIMSANIWAPEIHFIQGKWYIYFAAARVDSRFDHRIYVLENESADPMTGTWKEKGRIATTWETFSLDATEFEHSGVHYLVWAQRNPSVRGNSNLYIAEMENPWTIKGGQVLISRPEFPWERQGFWVNEGPTVLVKNGKVIITYSASATDARYCMGMLIASASADLLDAASWTKSGAPIFTTDEARGMYGPGHNSFTTEDGRDVMIFHARSYRDIVGDPLYDPNRNTWAVIAGFRDDGGLILKP